MLPHLTLKRYLVEKDAFTAKVEELGGKVIFMSADNDEEKQMQQVKDILNQGIDILVLDPVNRFKAAELIRLAHDKGVKVISYDRLAANCDVDAFITFDASAIGKQMTSYALKKKPQGEYIIVGGDKSDINAILINESVEKTLGPSVKSGNIKIQYKTFIEKYSFDDAQNELITCFKLSQKVPDVIITAGDVLATAAIAALKDFDSDGKVIITGQNSDLLALKNILKGKQAMTIYKPVKKMAVLTAEIAVNLSKHKKVNQYFKNTLFNGSINVPSTFMDVVTVDATNIKSTVIADGFYTESEIFN
jgi:D-xylose transport system substrate-binding protein